MIVCDKLTICSGPFRLQNISFRIPAGAYGALMGPTGSGKTTLLESLCGLRAVEAGTIVLNDEQVTRLPPAERCIGYVPQDAALFARMTVYDNVAFSLHVRKAPKQTIARRVDELAERLSIGHLLSRKATGLSGGETQRVALGRALASCPSILLLDEPLSALDESTHGRMVDLLKQIHVEAGVTVLHVTHSRSEADCLADTFVEIDGGRVRQHLSSSNNSTDPSAACIA